MEDRIAESVTRQFKAVFPCMLNANNTVFGGEVLKWMDEVAYITATRFAREHMFTVNTEKIKFLKTIPPDTIVEIIGRIEKVKLIRIHVKVEIYAEEMYSRNREKVVEGTFVFVALDNKQQPKQLDCLSLKRTP